MFSSTHQHWDFALHAMGHLVESQKPLPKPVTSVVEAQLRAVNYCSSSSGCCWKKGLATQEVI